MVESSLPLKGEGQSSLHSNITEETMAKEEKHCAIDVEEDWVKSLREELQGTCRKRRRGEPSTIFRVPANIRKADPSAYEPKIISFGPYHHDKPQVKAMDRLKRIYLKRIIRRNTDVCLEDYIKKIKGLEARARLCYSDDINMGSGDFVKMMMLDGCFIVELLLMQKDESIHELEEEEEGDDDDEDNSEGEEEDPILTTTWALPLVEYDMIILENQVPFFVLETLFKLATGLKNKDQSSSLIKLTLEFFGDLFPNTPSAESAPRLIHHFLHLFHSCVKPAQQHEHDGSSTAHRKLTRNTPSRFWPWFRFGKKLPSPLLQTPESIPCAKELKEAGVKFIKKEAKSFLEVTFRGGIMEIPRLPIYDETNTLFRNLIAFEQCYPKSGSYVTTYALFMDCVVDTPADVAMLHHYGVIVNGLGDDKEAAGLFNKLCKGIPVDIENCYLADLFKDVSLHCSSRANEWRAKLMRDYFSSPWAFLSLLGALIILALTAIQTGYSIGSYYPH